MLNKKIFFVVGLLFCLSFVSAEISISPYEILQDTSATIDIDLESYSENIYFYKEGQTSAYYIISLGCEGNLCYEPKTFDYVFSSDFFSIGEYSFAIYSYDINDWMSVNFEIIEEEVEICTDSDVTEEYPDGFNLYVKGIVQDEGEDPPQSEDYCYNDDQLFEYWCYFGGDSGYGGGLYNCPNGCENGTCIEVVACTDSDGGVNYCKKGTVCEGDGCFTDYCLVAGGSFNYVNEYSCENNILVSEVSTCLEGCEDGACIRVLHHHKICYYGDVFWIDSCNDVEELFEECSNDCVDGACVEEEAEDKCSTDSGSQGYCDVEWSSVCETLECSECDCLVACEEECAVNGWRVGYCTPDICSCSSANDCFDLPEPEPELVCEDGTAYNTCSLTKPKYCDSSENLIDNCQECGCGLFLECNDGGSCSPAIPIASNTKVDLYSDKEVFLVSDKDWRNVLPFVPVAVWTQGEVINKCPFLIYHEEESDLDIDSIIYFMQQYNPDKVTIIGQTPQKLDDLLIAEPDFGAGLQEEDIQKISTTDALFYWGAFDTIVYVEDNYELALLASTYASLINAPLIIKETESDSAGILAERNVICVGDVSPQSNSCFENYNLEELQQKYFDETNTNKLILINPLDWIYSIHDDYTFLDTKLGIIDELYTKISLSASILASAKHELIISTTETDYQLIDTFTEQKIKDFNADYLTIMASGNTTPHKEFKEPSILGFDIYWALDPSHYADIDGDNEPDVAVGRIAGISTSDVSSYVARDLFYDSFPLTSNMGFMASSFVGVLAIYTDLLAFINTLRTSGYNTISRTVPDEGYEFSPLDWENKDMIYYSDHGAPSWAGIRSRDIPELSNSVIATAACSTASSYDEYSFWALAIRQGAIAFVGSVDTTFLSTNYNRFIKNLYYNDYPTMGDAFKDSYSSQNNIAMATLIGDPTLEIGLANACIKEEGSSDDFCSECSPIDLQCSGKTIRGRYFRFSGDKCVKKTFRKQIGDECEYGCSEIGGPHCRTIEEYDVIKEECLSTDPTDLICNSEKDTVRGRNYTFNEEEATCDKETFREVVEECEEGGICGDYSTLCYSYVYCMSSNSHENAIQRCESMTEIDLICRLGNVYGRTYVFTPERRAPYFEECVENTFREQIGEDCEYGCKYINGSGACKTEEENRAEVKAECEASTCTSNDAVDLICRYGNLHGRKFKCTGMGCVEKVAREEIKDCVNYCKDEECTCDISGTKVSIFTQHRCCNGWEWVTEKIHKWPKCGVGRGWGCGKLTHDRGYKIVNDYKKCK